MKDAARGLRGTCRSPAMGWRLCVRPPQTKAPGSPCCCRVYCHHLAVVDDWEFWERQQPFSLGQQRAIAAALNTLVFRTQLPDNSSGGGVGGSSSGAGRPAGGKGGSLGRDYCMLQQAAPLLHRCAAMSRRPLCAGALAAGCMYNHAPASLTLTFAARL